MSTWLKWMLIGLVSLILVSLGFKVRKAYKEAKANNGGD